MSARRGVRRLAAIYLDRFSIRRRAEALASADTRTLKRALYDETQTGLTATSYQLRYELPDTGWQRRDVWLHPPDPRVDRRQRLT